MLVRYLTAKPEVGVQHPKSQPSKQSKVPTEQGNGKLFLSITYLEDAAKGAAYVGILTACNY